MLIQSKKGLFLVVIAHKSLIYIKNKGLLYTYYAKSLAG